jgi:hypothetical protein
MQIPAVCNYAAAGKKRERAEHQGVEEKDARSWKQAGAATEQRFN